MDAYRSGEYVRRSPDTVIPPLLRRCPDCGHLGAARRFGTVTADGRRLVECPVCGYRFAPPDDPRLA